MTFHDRMNPGLVQIGDRLWDRLWRPPYLLSLTRMEAAITYPQSGLTSSGAELGGGIS